MLKLELNKKELEMVKYDKEAIRNLLLSRAIYNESLEYEFTNEELKNIEFFEKTEALKLYMRKTVAPRVMVNENTIIEEYTKNKDFFEGQGVSFKEAHDIIKNDLTNQVNYGLEQDLVKKLIENMDKSVSLTREDIQYTNGDPNLLKTVLLNTLLEKEAVKINFFEENKQELDLLKQEIRMNYYVRVINSKGIDVETDEISKYYIDNTKQFENMDMQVAYNQIYNHLLNEKISEKTNKYAEEMIEKYNINQKVEQQSKKEVIN